MTRLLMLDFDQRLVAAVTRALEQEGVSVVGAASVEEALEQLVSQDFDAALLDCDVIDAEELTAFSVLPTILTTAFLEPEGQHRFFRQARLLRKPFTSVELLSALHEACTELGRESANLVDVLRRAHSAGQSVGFDVGGALVFLEDGELVHAELGSALGERALAEALAQSGSRPIAIPARKVARTIHRPFQALMLDLLRHLEEREREEPSRVQRSQLRPLHKGPRS
jgi:DNA-binding response OmpR family regulator